MSEDVTGIVVVFGTWDAPLTDGAERLMCPPESESCIHCREHFKGHDNGAILPGGAHVHRECHLRAVLGGIGHLVDHARYCTGELGPDAGLTYRQSAWLVWRTHVEWERFTVEDIESIRRLEGGA